MMKNNKKIIVIFLVLSFCLTGCGNIANETVPELIEPTILEESRRPVERGNIAEETRFLAKVVPTEYCQFYNTDVNISEIAVDYGDYVEKGDIIAYADVESIKKLVNSSVADLEYENFSFEINDKIHEIQLNKLNYQKKSCEEAGETEKAAQIEVSVNVENENRSYDKMLHDYRVKKLNETINERRKSLENATLKASHSGYVTYIKDLSNGSNASIYENIVIVSDYNDLYIECNDLTVKQYSQNLYKNSVEKYTYVNGVKKKVTEFEYSFDELVKAKVSGSYPNQRFLIEGDTELKMGDSLYLYLAKNVSNDCLIIYSDSLYTDTNGSFVYIEDENGNRTKREVTTGLVVDNQIEILSGLSEGDKVYYNSGTIVPSEYVIFEVERSTYTVTAKSQSFSLAQYSYLPIFSKYSGRITDIKVSKNDEVTKGDEILEIETGGGRAELMEAKNSIDALDTQYKKSVEDNEKAISEINDRISAIEDEKANLDAGNLSADSSDIFGNEISEGDNTEEAGDSEEIGDSEEAGNSEGTENTEYSEEADDIYIVEELRCDIDNIKYSMQLAELNYNKTREALVENYNALKEDNDGTGTMIVKAPKDSVIVSISGKVNSTVSGGNLIATIAYEKNKKIKVEMRPLHGFLNGERSAAEVGATVTFVGTGTDNANTKYYGTCIANASSYDKTYIFTAEDGKVYQTFCGNSKPVYDMFYVDMEDDSFYEEMPKCDVEFSKQSMSSVIIVPSTVVHNEHLVSQKKDVKFVWRLVDGCLVKQYVTTDDTVSASGDVAILTGLKAGDTVCAEVINNEE